MPILLDPEPPPVDPVEEIGAWAASGAMALTGPADGPALGPPAGLVTRLRVLSSRLAAGAAALRGTVQVDALALLGERAAIAGLHRHGTVSCGGASRLLSCDGGWLALSLARRDDVALVPAWLELDGPAADPWGTIEQEVARRGGEELISRARLLGLPAAWLPADPVAAPARPAIRDTSLGAAGPVAEIGDVTVVELGSLWAGPLCGSLLASAGADVIKVESTGRPDGARSGPPAFFDLLNAGKRSVALDLATSEGVRVLHALLACADVVIEASRPRALEQLGIDALSLLAGDGPRAWVSITGHGRTGSAREWVAFGDDAAVAGGLVAWSDGVPVFCADAIADPTTGVVAALVALEALATGGRHLLDVPLAGVAAHLAGPTLPVRSAVVVAEPRARPAAGRGPRLGEHTEEVVTGLGITRR